MEWNELYTAEELSRLENRIRILRPLLILAGAAALAVCILLCCLTNTANAERMEITVIALSTGAGWLLLYLRRFILLELRHELGHAQMLRDSERETVRGSVEVSKEKLRIRNSIPFRNVTVEEEGKTRQVKVIETKAEVLEKAGKELELSVANGYAAAFRKL